MDYAGQFKQSQEGRARFNLCYAHEPRARCVVKFCLQVLYTVTLFVCAVIVHLLLSLAGGSRAVEGSEERYHFVFRDGFFFDKDGVKTVQSFMMDNPDVGKLDKHGQPEPARIATGTMLCNIALEPILSPYPQVCMCYAGLRSILLGRTRDVFIGQNRKYPEAVVMKMKKPAIVEILESHADFQATKPVLVELIEGLSPSFQVVFLPKFHCEVSTALLFRCLPVDVSVT